VDPPNYDSTFYIDSYDGVLKNAMHALKYQQRLACAVGFAYLWNQSTEILDSESSIDFLLPVPLSQQKLAVRGFNQSWEIAKNLRLPQQIRRVPNALCRTNNRESQVGRDKVNRKKAVYDQFYINRDWLKRFENKRIVLFDDVMTTGATVNAIASLLKNHGAKHVSAWLILRTLPKEGECAI
jgi:ComF family protein